MRAAAETERLGVLRSYQVLDAPEEDVFASIVTAAAQVLGAPMGVIGLVDQDREWFLARRGVGLAQTGRRASFADHVIRDGEPLVVRDARSDGRFDTNPLVRDSGARFYAGVPIVTADGLRLGALGVLARDVPAVDEEKLATLRVLAGHVRAELDVRRLFRQVLESRDHLLDTELLVSMIEHAPVMMFAKEWPSLHHTLWNRAAEAVTGVPRQELLGRTGYESFPAEEIAAFHQRDQRVFGEWKRVDAEETVTGPTGTRLMRTRKIPLQAADGTKFLLGISEDVTDLRAREKELDELNHSLEARVEERSAQLQRLEAQLHRARRLESLGRLAGGVAHDFNNLLTVVLGYAGLLAREPGLTERQKREVRFITEAGTRGSQLTQQLLAFGRRQIRRPRPLNLWAVAQGALSLVDRMTSHRSEVVLVDEPAELWAADADQAQLEQILINLACNADDAMPEGGRICIGVANVPDAADEIPGLLAGPAVRLQVSDEGEGMTADVRDHIFEPFFSTKAEGRGTGLGLATVFGIVKQSGGAIVVDSEPGAGAVFRIYFPRSDQRAVRPEVPVAPAEVGADAPRGDETVLVVDDDEAVRGFLAEVLRRGGYDVLEAASPGDALLDAEDRAESIGLIVSDVAMPRMTGPELVERLRRDRPGLRALFLSGYASDSSPVPAEATLLDKPVLPDELLAAVRAELDRE